MWLQAGRAGQGVGSSPTESWLGHPDRWHPSLKATQHHLSVWRAAAAALLLRARLPEAMSACGIEAGRARITCKASGNDGGNNATHDELGLRDDERRAEAQHVDTASRRSSMRRGRPAHRPARGSNPLLPLLPACHAGGAVSTAARRHCANQLAAAAADRSRSSIRSGRGLQATRRDAKRFLAFTDRYL